LWRFPYAG
jgi:hypothetical protein